MPKPDVWTLSAQKKKKRLQVSRMRIIYNSKLFKKMKLR